MPFVNISLLEGKPPEYIKAVADGVHDAIVAVLGVSPCDRFQIVHELKPHQLFIDRTYLCSERSQDALIVHIVLRKGRIDKVKSQLMRRIVDNLAKSPGVGKQDVVMVITENASGDWSFSNGEQQLTGFDAIAE